MADGFGESSMNADRLGKAGKQTETAGASKTPTPTSDDSPEAEFIVEGEVESIDDTTPAAFGDDGGGAKHETVIYKHDSDGASEKQGVPYNLLPDAQDTKRTLVYNPKPGSQRAKAIDPPEVDDEAFARLVRRSKLVPDEQIDECLEITATISSMGVKKRLSEVLIEKGYLGAAQARVISFALKKGEEGGLIGGFQLIEKIGEGGMGEVYKARQVSLDRTVALKLLPERLAADPEFVARFESEARAAARLSHPNIVGAVDIGQAAGKYFFAMEYIDGWSVLDLIKTEGRLSEERALDIVIQAARGLEFAWRNGIVHRDIKPDNIMLTSDDVAKIADLGLARQATCDDWGQCTDGSGGTSRATRAGAIMGSPHYMSPEQAYGYEEIDTRIDIYSLGVTLYQMVTGELPFKGKDPMAVIQARFVGAVTPACDVNPDVSVGLANVINVMMAISPDERYPDPRVLLHDLMLVADGHDPEFASADKAAQARAVTAAASGRLTAHSIVRRPVVKKTSKAPIIIGVIVGVAALATVAAAVAVLMAQRPQPSTNQPAAEDRARLARLTDEAKARYDGLAAKAEAGAYDEVLEALTGIGTEFAQTTYQVKFETLRIEVTSRIEQRKRAEEAQQRDARRFQELLTIARDELATGNYAGALPLIVQAKAIKDGPEVQTLLKQAERIRDTARGDEAVRNGDLRAAAEFYRSAVASGGGDEVKAKLEDTQRRSTLADHLAAARRLIDKDRLREANQALTLAMESARGDEKPAVQAERDAVKATLAYRMAIHSARGAAADKEWNSAIRYAEQALTARPGDADARDLVEKAREALGPQPRIVDSIGMTFVLVPAGRFTMGSASGGTDERPPHETYVDAFYMSAYETTNAQFERFISGHRTKWKKFSPDDDTPVISVTWEEANAFCTWMTEKEGVEYRLPTEAEWERAARGDDKRAYPWGNNLPDAAGSHRCNYAPDKGPAGWKKDGHEFTAPVGSYPGGASPFGCMDMAGNVWEWCADWYAADYYGESPEENPKGPDTGTRRVMRGGSLTYNADTVTATNRMAKEPTFYEANVGFRCVRAVRTRTPETTIREGDRP
jgi:serine/threonine-protein kinase